MVSKGWSWGVPIMAQWKQICLGTMRLRVQSLAAGAALRRQKTKQTKKGGAGIQIVADLIPKNVLLVPVLHYT